MWAEKETALHFTVLTASVSRTLPPLFLFTCLTLGIATKSLIGLNQTYTTRTATNVVETFLGGVTELRQGGHD